MYYCISYKILYESRATHIDINKLPKKEFDYLMRYLQSPTHMGKFDDAKYYSLRTGIDVADLLIMKIAHGDKKSVDSFRKYHTV